MKKNLLLCAVTGLVFVVMGCGGVSPSEVKTLAGTIWKIEGIVDTQTKELKILEPRDCEKCYTLQFKMDNIFETYTSINGICGNYIVDYDDNDIFFINLMGTKIGESSEDGNNWWGIITAIQSFSLQNNKLLLYYNDNRTYLLFKYLGEL